MAEPAKKPTKKLRTIDPAFVALGPSGVSIRDRLKGLTPEDEKVLARVGAHLGSLASKDLKARCADGLEHFHRVVGGPQAGVDRRLLVAVGRFDHEGHA